MDFVIRFKFSGASSAPLLAKVDFIEYKEIVGASIRSVGGEECFRRFEGAFSQAEQLIAVGNFAEFSNRFRTCDELTSDNLDIWSMFGLFSDLLAGVVQYHRFVIAVYNLHLPRTRSITITL